MAHYLVRYSIGANNEYLYPESVAGVVWKSTVYHFTDHVMVGETDAKIKADGKQVVALTPNTAKIQIKKYQSSYPKSEETPDALRLPRK